MNTWMGGRRGLPCFVLATSKLGWPEEVGVFVDGLLDLSGDFSCCIVEGCKEPLVLGLCRGTLHPAGLKREEDWIVSR